MVQRTGIGAPAHGHVVLASADSEAFTSLRKRSTSRIERYRLGKEIRQRVPRNSLGDWVVRTDRPDPVQLINESHRGRLEWLIPVRVGRMTASPYGFLRGAAVVMAEDVAFTVERDGERRIVEDPPLITRVPAAEAEALAAGLDEYLATLAPHWRRVLGGYTLVDIAHKVVGVGSVGLRAYVALLEGSSPDDVLFLQLKQARRSVLAPYVHGESAWHAHQGQRVVEYQQALQTVSDPLLGWTSFGGHQYYVRQFRNMKGTVALDSIDGSALADYAAIVGHLLAKGHARTSGASMIVGYVGRSDHLDIALARFARLYADQTEADHAALVKAAAQGVVPVERGL